MRRGLINRKIIAAVRLGGLAPARPIRDRQPTAWDDFACPAEAEATCIWKVSPQIYSSREISKIQYYKCQVGCRFCEISEEYDVKTTLF